MAKDLISGTILARLVQAWAPHFLIKKICLCQSLDIMVRNHNVQYQKKLMIQSRENLVTDRRRDGRTEGKTDEGDFIGRCPTNVERPKICFPLPYNNDTGILRFGH